MHCATRCNTPQYTATHCATPQRIHKCIVLRATYCNTLQHTATHCNTLQRIHECIVLMNTLQRIHKCIVLHATHCNTVKHKRDRERVCMCVCACPCVCVRERDREGERVRVCVFSCVCVRVCELPTLLNLFRKQTQILRALLQKQTYEFKEFTNRCRQPQQWGRVHETCLTREYLYIFMNIYTYICIYIYPVETHYYEFGLV